MNDEHGKEAESAQDHDNVVDDVHSARVRCFQKYVPQLIVQKPCEVAELEAKEDDHEIALLNRELLCVSWNLFL